MILFYAALICVSFIQEYMFLSKCVLKMRLFSVIAIHIVLNFVYIVFFFFSSHILWQFFIKNYIYIDIQYIIIETSHYFCFTLIRYRIEWDTIN